MIYYLEDYDASTSFAAQYKNMLVKLNWQKENYLAQAKIVELNTVDEYKGLATETTHYGYGLARNVMSFLTGKIYNRSIEELPGDAARSTNEQATEIQKVKNEKLTEGFTIFPNPNHGTFNLVWDIEESSLDGLKYRIVNIQGQVVKEGSLNTKNGTKQLKINEIQGVYHVQFSNSKKVFYQTSIVVNE